MKKSELIIKIINIACAVVILALIVCQFLPFWTTNDGISASVQSVTWFPKSDNQQQVQKYFQSVLGKDVYKMRPPLENSINHLVAPAVGVLCFGLLGLYFCLVKSNKPINFIWALACGLSCVIGYLVVPPYMLGANWIVHVALGGVIIALSIVLLVYWIIDVIHWFKG